MTTIQSGCLLSHTWSCACHCTDDLLLLFFYYYFKSN